MSRYSQHNLILVVVMGLELIFNRLPIRLFHFIFPVCYGLMFVLANYLSHMVKRGRTADLTIKDHHEEIVDWKDNKGEGFSVLQVQDYNYWIFISYNLKS